jgi:hypothetical protein
MDYAVEASRLIEDVITRQRQKKDETMTPEELKQQEDANAEVMREHYTALTGILDAVVQTFGESHPVTEDFRQMANYVFRVNDTRGYYVPQGADGKYMRNSVSRDYKNPGERDINYLLDIIKKYNVFFRSLNEALNNEYNITDEEIEMTNMWAKQFVAGSKKFVEALQNHDVDNAKIIYRQNILHYFRKIKEKFQGGAVVDAFKVLFRPHREIMHTIKENPSFLDNIRQPEQPQEQPEETVVPESYRRSGRMIREEGTKLNVFGHHPGYRKKPMTLPQTGSDRDGNYRDWNDESVYSEEPFGKEIGSSEPFEARISKTVDMVMESLKKKTILERKVLQVPDQGTDMNMPTGAEQMPPMEDPGMMGPDDSEMGGAMPDEGGMPSEFDSNFDAGVEADEETDPETYIQQLTGKLSQSLNSYNNESGEPNPDLNKYAVNMVVKQAVKVLDDKDRKDIIKNINTTSSEDTDEDMADEVPVDDNTDETPQPQNECKVYNFTKKQIFESLGIGIGATETPKEEKRDRTIPKNATTGNRGIPFKAPRNIKK